LFDNLKIVDKNSDYKYTETLNPSNKITTLSKKSRKNEKTKGNLFESFDFFLKNRYIFPHVKFISYYFNFLIPKKQKNTNSSKSYCKIVKNFSKKLLEKLDLFYYLKLVRTIKLFKNSYLRKKISKDSIKFLLKNQYFVRDCDIKSIIGEIENN